MAFRSRVRRSAALDGVEARISAARSARLSSTSWPIPVMTGILLAAMARTSCSSLKTARSSALPPPRRIAIISTPPRSLKCCSARIICSAAAIPWTWVLMVLISRPPQRFSRIFRKSIYPAAAVEEITPIFVGSTGRGRLRAGSKRPSVISFFFSSSKLFLMLPSPTGIMRLIVRENLPQRVNLGVARTRTCIPSDKATVSWLRGIKQLTEDSPSFKSKKTHLP